MTYIGVTPLWQDPFTRTNKFKMLVISFWLKQRVLGRVGLQQPERESIVGEYREKLDGGGLMLRGGRRSVYRF